MCTRFVLNGRDMITGFNFDIDLSVWKHQVIEEKDRFYIGILRPDGTYHSYHGVNRNGNAGTLQYVHGNPAGAYQDSSDCMTIADLTEQFIKAQISFEDALQIVRSRKITYAQDAAMQAMLSEKRCPQDTIDALLAIKWWDWPEERIARHIGDIQAGNMENLIQFKLPS